MTADAAFLTVARLGQAFRAKELSPTEATEAVLARIEAHDERVNAYCLVDPEAALEQARRSTDRYARGEEIGPLDGVPVAIKDVFLTVGWPTLKGSKAIDPRRSWEEDAPVVAALRAAGAVFPGKTTTPELGWKGVTDGPLTGVTRNPWDPSRTPGGSSGGSATAVVLGMAAASLGTDGGGSIRIPAAFSGLVGLKPTFGRIPHWPPSPFGTLSHAGPMSRTVEDAALLLGVLAAPDHRDWQALPPWDADPQAELEGGVDGLRVAFSPDLGFVDVDPEVAEAVRRAAEDLEELGAEVEEVDPPFADPTDYFEVIWYAGAATAVKGFEPDARREMDPGLLEVAEAGRGLSAVQLLEAAGRRDELGIAMSLFLRRHHLLATPTVPMPAFEAGREVPAGWPHRRWHTWTPFTYPFNLTQQPAVSVPCGFTSEGLPVGLQIVGPKHADTLVLRAAHAYQQARPLWERRPDWAT